MAAAEEDSPGIRVSGMQFSYEAQQPPLFLDFNLNVKPGSRCLLVGANGSGNLTILVTVIIIFVVGGDVTRARISVR